jgi:prepilin-type N-terminal cleavage/methylation domain-containing protein
MKKTKKNFTLVELLCAVALIVILAGIGFSAYSYASHRGKETATKSLITQFEAALETLKTKHGFYPASTTSSYNPVEVVVQRATGTVVQINFGGTQIPKSLSSIKASEEKQLKDFLAIIDAENLRKHLVKHDSDSTYDKFYIADAWDGKLQYKYPGTINKLKFDIVAPGADGAFGTAADEDTLPTTLAGYQENDEWACDDIANFMNK